MMSSTTKTAQERCIRAIDSIESLTLENIFQLWKTIQKNGVEENFQSQKNCIKNLVSENVLSVKKLLRGRRKNSKEIWFLFNSEKLKKNWCKIFSHAKFLYYFSRFRTFPSIPIFDIVWPIWKIVSQHWWMIIIAYFVCENMRAVLIFLKFCVCTAIFLNSGKHVYLCSKFISNYKEVYFFKCFAKFCQIFLKIFLNKWSLPSLLGLNFIILKFLFSDVPKINFEISQIFYKLSPILM